MLARAVVIISEGLTGAAGTASRFQSYWQDIVLVIKWQLASPRMSIQRHPGLSGSCSVLQHNLGNDVP